MAPSCIVVPIPAAGPAVELVRWHRRSSRLRLLGRDAGRGMPPHVTLLYPFIDDAQLTDAQIDEVRTIVRSFVSFAFTLAEVSRFDNLPKESYVWLAPSPPEPFVELVESLASAFPEHPPFGGAFSTIVPHLTIASSTDGDVLRRVEDQVLGELPIETRATTVSIMEHVRGVWRLRAEAPLQPS